LARRKKTFHNVHIVDIGDRGMAIGKTEAGQVVLVQGAVPEDVVDVLVLRKKKGLPLGIIQELKSPSPLRTDPFCAHFGICGGCKWQHLEYKSQLSYKEKSVENTLKRIGQVENVEFLPIVGAESDRYYRNKLEFSFSNKRWITEEEIKSGEQFEHRDGVGFHCPGAFDKVVDVDQCWLQPDPSNQIRNATRAYAHDHGISFYDIKHRGGVLRSMIVRSNRLGEIMIILSIFDEEIGAIEGLIKDLTDQFEAIKSVYYCVNQKGNDTILDLPLVHVFGSLHLEEHLLDVQFQIGPKSFFQTNPMQAEKLFTVAKDFAALTGDQIVYDLYCGIGSITLAFAAEAKQMIGVEEVPEAIEDAKINAALNEISNAHFYAGDVRFLLNQEMINRHGKPDLLVTDPPRVGMHGDVVQAILDFEPEKIVYVSCNVSTQARDLKLLSEKYNVIRSQAVDMFPHTHHIENVALLQIKAS
jgi:23S rRNA (uracil1939-C5)-methyltransferase